MPPEPPTPDAPDTTEPSFEASLERVEDVVRELETGQIPLAASLARYEEGIRALKLCQQMLDQAEAKIELLSRGPDGSLERAPLPEHDVDTGELR